MEIGCKEYAMQMLVDAGCELSCYQGISVESITRELQDYFSELGKEPCYPYEDIANCLKQISDEQPQKIKHHKKYQFVFDTENFTDGREYDDFEEAKGEMIETYSLWMGSEMHEWDWGINGMPNPTPEQIEAWDMMIENCTCWIAEWNEDEQTYYDEKMNYYFMSDEDANGIGWLPWEELKVKLMATNN